MRVAVIGLGIQGRKRLAIAGADVVATVDPVAPDACYKAIEQVPREAFDAALVCIPDQAKVAVMTYLLSHGKHVLVEKPLLAAEDEPIHRLADLARAHGAACYTAYNHRFEPHLVRLREALQDGAIGTVYLVRGLYGNGTALDVKRSSWRDQGLGVLADLGSHLMDLVLFFFGRVDGRCELWSAHRFENRAYDHALFGSVDSHPAFVLEGTLLSWRNTFTLDVYGERGSLHVNGLCKWGPSQFILRRRVLPSGKPEDARETVECPDPTWALEYAHFKALCRTGGTNLENDLWITRALNEAARELKEVSDTFPALKSA